MGGHESIDVLDGRVVHGQIRRCMKFSNSQTQSILSECVRPQVQMRMPLHELGPKSSGRPGSSLIGALI